jgi:dTDP-4-dehydrorhamnose reductase
MILILGSEGQLTQSFQHLLKTENRLGYGVQVLGRKEIDFLNPEATIKKISKYHPKWIINAAAYTMVDKAETEKELCYQINALTPIRIAQWCKEENVNFIHYSTDYVFDGSGKNPWFETDHTNPINYYGQTKRASEEGIIQTECPHLIFRISWVYHSLGNNFVKTMLRLGAEREELKIVNDQVGYPSFAPDLARASLSCIEQVEKNKTVPFELLHLSSSHHTTWFDFAEAIFAKTREKGIPLKIKNLVPISSQEYPTPAKRPLNSRLNSEKIKNLYGITLPHWQDSLNECLNQIF